MIEFNAEFDIARWLIGFEYLDQSDDKILVLYVGPVALFIIW